MRGAEYIQRAQEALGGPVSGAFAALDRGACSESLDGPVIGGWWCPAESPRLLVLPNPWDDRSLVAEYDERAWSITNEALGRLPARLNRLHGLDLREDYWEVLLAPWLLIMAAVVLDRCLFLATVREVAPGSRVLVTSGRLEPMTSLLASVSATRTEAFNQALMGELAAHMGLPTAHVPAQRLGASDAKPRARQLLPGIRMAASNVPLAVGRALAHSMLADFRGRRLALVGLHRMSFRQLVALARAVPGLRVAPRQRMPRPQHVDLSGPAGEHHARPLLSDAGIASDEPAALLDRVLPRLVPRSIVEGYGDLVDASQRAYGPTANVLHGNYSYDDLPNELAARSVAAGRQIAFAQHGGCAETLEIAPAERLEHRAGSIRLTWGGQGPGIRAVPSPYVQRLANTHRGGAMVVVVEPLAPPDTYVFRFTTVPLGNQAYIERERLLRFVGQLGPQVREAAVLKRFPGAEAASVRSSVLQELPVPRRLARRPAIEWMRRARVVVVPYPDTPFIEAMVMGAPVIGLWDRALWGFREDAQGVFDELADVGVVHDDPSAAARMLDDVYPRAQSWWASPEIAAARGAFLERFAKIGDWLGPWTDAAREIARG